jgi:hypothetical protein
MGLCRVEIGGAFCTTPTLAPPHKGEGESAIHSGRLRPTAISKSAATFKVRLER